MIVQFNDNVVCGVFVYGISLLCGKLVLDECPADFGAWLGEDGMLIIKDSIQ